MTIGRKLGALACVFLCILPQCYMTGYKSISPSQKSECFQNETFKDKEENNNNALKTLLCLIFAIVDFMCQFLSLATLAKYLYFHESAYSICSEFQVTGF